MGKRGHPCHHEESARITPNPHKQLAVPCPHCEWPRNFLQSLPGRIPSVFLALSNARSAMLLLIKCQNHHDPRWRIHKWVSHRRNRLAPAAPGAEVQPSECSETECSFSGFFIFQHQGEAHIFFFGVGFNRLGLLETT